MNVNLIVLLAYCAVMVAIGVVIGSRVKKASGFFVAGRRLGPGLLFATVMAANIGAGSTVGAAGLAYRDGASAWWWVGSAAIGTLLLGWWVGPRIWRLAKEHDLRTLGDYLEWRYSPAVRGTISVLLWFGTLAILAGQLIAMAAVLEAVAGFPKVAGCLLGGLVMTAYFVAGGLLSSAWVNLIQLAVLLAGFLVAAPLALEAGAGWQTLRAMEPAADYWNVWRGGESGWPYLALLVPAFIISPGLVQKVYGARDERTVRLSLTVCGLALMIFAALPPLLGIVARSLHPGLPMDLALPTLLVKDLPATVGLLGLAAVFSAEISSADAILFMLATSLSQDLYRRFVRPDASDARVLSVARLAALAGGLLGVLLAILLPTVISSLTIFYSLLSVSLFVPVLAGLHSRRPGSTEVLWAIGAGIAALIAVRYRLLPWTQGLHPTLAGLVTSAVAFAVACAVPRAPRAAARS